MALGLGIELITKVETIYTTLKGVSGQTNWGSKVGSIDRYWYGTVALEV